MQLFSQIVERMTSHFKEIQLNVDPARIVFLKFLLEGYDCMTVLSTLNRDTGTIFIRYVRCFEQQLCVILKDFERVAQPDSIS